MLRSKGWRKFSYCFEWERGSRGAPEVEKKDIKSSVVIIHCQMDQILLVTNQVAVNLATVMNHKQLNHRAK